MPLLINQTFKFFCIHKLSGFSTKGVQYLILASGLVHYNQRL